MAGYLSRVPHTQRSCPKNEVLALKTKVSGSTHAPRHFEYVFANSSLRPLQI